MKKPSPYLRARLIRISSYKNTRKLKKNKNKKSKLNVFIAPRDIINAPTRFCLTGGLAIEVVKFLKAVSIQVLKLKKPVTLNFRNTESFYVPGTIYLFAELNRIISSSTLPKPVTIIDPYRRRPREVLKQIEIYKLTGDKNDVIPEREDVVFWKSIKGSDQSGDGLGPLIESVTEKANHTHIKQVEVSGIWRGVSEAVANVVDHAYDMPRKDGFNGLKDTKWWMFTQIRDQRFTAAVCDLGCGYSNTINQTIPESFLSQFKELLLGTNKDSVAIDIAMKYGRSGTKRENRGKGSRDALSVLTKHGQGELTIISNSGLVAYKLIGNSEEITMNNLGIDIGGTIVWWRLPLAEFDDENN